MTSISVGIRGTLSSLGVGALLLDGCFDGAQKVVFVLLTIGGVVLVLVFIIGFLNLSSEVLVNEGEVAVDSAVHCHKHAVLKVGLVNDDATHEYLDLIPPGP